MMHKCVNVISDIKLGWIIIFSTFVGLTTLVFSLYIIFFQLAFFIYGAYNADIQSYDLKQMVVFDILTLIMNLFQNILWSFLLLTITNKQKKVFK